MHYYHYFLLDTQFDNTAYVCCLLVCVCVCAVKEIVDYKEKLNLLRVRRRCQRGHTVETVLSASLSLREA